MLEGIDVGREEAQYDEGHEYLRSKGGGDHISMPESLT
jgi:hypothetical protein